MAGLPKRLKSTFLDFFSRPAAPWYIEKNSNKMSILAFEYEANNTAYQTFFSLFFKDFWLTVSIDLVLIIGIKLGGRSWNRLHREMIFHRHTVWSCPIFSGSVHSNPNGCRWGHTWGWSSSEVDVWPRNLHICSAISSVSNKNKIAVYWSGLSGCKQMEKLLNLGDKIRKKVQFVYLKS